MAAISLFKNTASLLSGVYNFNRLSNFFIEPFKRFAKAGEFLHGVKFSKAAFAGLISVFIKQIEKILKATNFDNNDWKLNFINDNLKTNFVC